ncbi:hypothetical protein LCGC14_0850380 [marine sediment metagenome]|uniref:Uncharacterized protein n=1 Tax=marine sediment metagenome TaxID=412755 RepID=A0A0F9SHI6_9ZZZZ
MTSSLHFYPDDEVRHQVDMRLYGRVLDGRWRERTFFGQLDYTLDVRVRLHTRHAMWEQFRQY